jgi:hypothetical protein
MNIKMRICYILIFSFLMYSCSDGYVRSYKYSKHTPSKQERVVRIHITSIILGLIPVRKINLKEEACGDAEIINITFKQPIYLSILAMVTLFTIDSKTIEVRCSG